MLEERNTDINDVDRICIKVKCNGSIHKRTGIGMQDVRSYIAFTL